MTTTTARTITRRDFTDMLEAVGLNEWEDITDMYYGRGTTKAAIGITVDPGNVAKVYAALGYAMGYAEADCENLDPWESLLRVAAQDSMGRDVIVYFPGWSFAV